MGIIEWLKRARPDKESSRMNDEPPAEIAARGDFRHINYQVGDFTLTGSEAIFSAVSRISNALSSMPINLYRDKEPVNSKLNDLMKYSPNPNMTSTDFFRTLEVSRDTNGNGYALKKIDIDMNVERFDILDPNRVTPMLDEQFGELWYRVQLDSGKEIYIHNWYMLHVKFISSNGYIGVNPIRVLTDTLQYNETIKRFSINQIEKGMNANIVLTAPTNLGEAQRKKAVKMFVDTYKETNGNILLLESGLEVKSLNNSPVDSKLLDVDKVTRMKVATVYNIPPHLLGDFSTTSNTIAAIEQQMIEFLTLTMLPIVTMYEQELGRKLLTVEQRRQGYHWKFDTNALLRTEIKTQAEVQYKAIRSASITPNEIRAQNGQAPKPNGDSLLISRDLIPLEVLMEHPELLLSGKLTETDEGGDEDEQNN